MLIIIFILAFIIRFLYFPGNIYFGFDQARDAFAALEISAGNLKLIGPPTSFPGLFHGVLYYYILAPLYFLGGGNPEFVAAFLRILNACGVFLIFNIASILFNRKVGLFAALLYAVNFEQSQFSIYMGNPTLANLSIMVMYLGLALVIFKKKNFGLLLVFFGLGFSIQFQFALFYLVIPMFLILFIFRKTFIKTPFKICLLAILIFILSVSTFILAEIKYGFKTVDALISLVNSEGGKNLSNIIDTYLYTIDKIVQFNLTGNLQISVVIIILILVVLIFYIRKKEYSKQLIFLSIWFFSLLVTFIINGGVSEPQKNIPLYYPNIGVSIALIIFVSFLFGKIFERTKYLATILMILILLANYQKISIFNTKGTIIEINAQQGMLLSDEKQILDYIYHDSDGSIAVKAVTMPFDINTTWSYLFEWYGLQKYGYLPIWNGKNAPGFPGNLKIQEAQEGLPQIRYVIIEPLRGVPMHLVRDYIKEEDYFTKIVDEKKIGQIMVQKRVKY